MGKQLPTRLTLCFLNLVFPLRFWSENIFIILPFPDLCLHLPSNNQRTNDPIAILALEWLLLVKGLFTSGAQISGTRRFFLATFTHAVVNPDWNLNYKSDTKLLREEFRDYVYDDSDKRNCKGKLPSKYKTIMNTKQGILFSRIPVHHLLTAMCKLPRQGVGV